MTPRYDRPIHDIAQAEYKNPEVVSGYEGSVRSVGLWESEKIVLKRFVPLGSRLLDLGCGAGRTTFPLYDAGYIKVVGADLSPRMIESCKQHSRKRGDDIPFFIADACSMPFPDSAFDAVFFSFNGLMTIPEYSMREAAVREISRVLSPGGVFIFTAHDIDDPRYSSFWALERAQWELGEQDGRVAEFGDVLTRAPLGSGDTLCFIHVPSRPEIDRLMSSGGFKIVYSSPRGEICDEPPEVKRFANDCVFFCAVKK